MSLMQLCSGKSDGSTLLLNARPRALRISSYPQVQELMKKRVNGGNSDTSSTSPEQASSCRAIQSRGEGTIIL